MLGRTSYADYDAEAGAYTTEFWHPLAFLKFHIDCSDCVYADAVLKSLTMTANVAFVGSVNVDCIGGTVTSTAVGDAGKTLVVNFPNTAVASSAQDAWVAIKPVDLTDANCQFVLEMTNGQKVTFAVNPAKVFKASHQYLLEFSDIDTKIAQKKGTQTYVDLIGRSGGNRANCYIVNSGGYYRFAAQKVDKSNVFAGSQPTTDGYKAYWFWCSGASSFISGVGIGNSGNINFRVNPNAEGNASIVLMDPSGVIVWSWHIWYSRTDPLTPTHYVYTSTYTLAKRNLGALSDDGAGGLYYQWGRKDPFPASNSSGSVFNSAVKIDGHGVSFNGLTSVNAAVTPDAIGYTISHPSTILYGSTYHTWITTEDQANNAQSLWSISASTKTNYDPCPPGYMVPISSNAWRDNFTAANVNFDEGGLTFDDGNTSSYYPASGYLNGWTFTNTEGYIRCWTATLSATPAYNAHMFGRSLFCKTSDSSISTTEAARSQFGMPVRCMVKP